MKRFFNSRKRIVTVGVVAAAIIAMTVTVFAFWTTTGGGTTTGSTASASHVAISGTMPQFAKLGDTVTFPVLLTNNNTSSIDESGKALTLTGVDCGGNPVTDYATWFTLAGNTTVPGPAGTTVLAASPGPGNTYSLTGVTLKINDLSAANQDACQGTSVIAHFSLN